MTTTPNPHLLDADQVAARLQISKRKLWELTNAGAIRCVRIGRLVRYDPGDVAAFVDRCKESTR